MFISPGTPHNAVKCPHQHLIALLLWFFLLVIIRCYNSEPHMDGPLYVRGAKQLSNVVIRNRMDHPRSVKR